MKNQGSEQSEVKIPNLNIAILNNIRNDKYILEWNKTKQEQLLNQEKIWKDQLEKERVLKSINKSIVTSIIVRNFKNWKKKMKGHFGQEWLDYVLSKQTAHLLGSFKHLKQIFHIEQIEPCLQKELKEENNHQEMLSHNFDSLKN